MFPFTHTGNGFRVAIEPNLCVFGLYVETHADQGEHTERHQPAKQLKPTALLLGADGTTITIHPSLNYKTLTSVCLIRFLKNTFFSFRFLTTRMTEL